MFVFLYLKKKLCILPPHLTFVLSPNCLSDVCAVISAFPTLTSLPFPISCSGHFVFESVSLALSVVFILFFLLPLQFVVWGIISSFVSHLKEKDCVCVLESFLSG